MAQQVTVQLVDDLDGSEASGTVEFAIDGREYVIDLSDENAAALRKVLDPYVDAGRWSGGRGKAGGGKVSVSAAQRERTAEIRRWASGNGFEVAERGRISAEVIEAYEAARNEQAGAAKRGKKASTIPIDPFATAS